MWLVWLFFFLITILHILKSSKKLYRNQVETLKYFWTFRFLYFSRPEISLDKIQLSHSPGVAANTRIADWIQSLLNLRRALPPRKWPQLPDYWCARFENLNIYESMGFLDLVLKTSENNNRKTMCLIAFIKGQFSFESTFWILLEKKGTIPLGFHDTSSDATGRAHIPSGRAGASLLKGLMCISAMVCGLLKAFKWHVSRVRGYAWEKKNGN